jgi:hypothetical protein
MLLRSKFESLLSSCSGPASIERLAVLRERLAVQQARLAVPQGDRRVRL